MLRVADDHFSHSDTGRQRRMNEDSYFARSPLFVVADGMGGAKAGEVASRMAVEAFDRELEERGNAGFEELLAERVQEANARIHALSRAEQERAGMGTTITAVHVGDSRVVVAHVGDSRAYRLRGDEFERLTQDHSLVEEMRRRGQLTAEEAEDHPQRSIITRALGPEPEVRVDTYSLRGEDGDIYLLCSDGLTSMVHEAQVAEIIRTPGTLKEIGHALVDAANEAGGRDNITVILFRLEEVEGGTEEPPVSASQETSITLGKPTRITTGPLKTDARAAVPTAPAPASSPSGQRLKPRPPTPPAGGKTHSPERPRRARRLTIAFAVLALIVLPLVVGAYLATQAVYFVGTDDDGLVTLYRGVPYELPAGIELYTVNYVSGVRAASVPQRRRTRLLDHSLRSRDDAADLVRQLERGRLGS